MGTMNVSDEILDFLVEQIPRQSLANFKVQRRLANEFGV
jgi:hypothetical protein